MAILEVQPDGSLEPINMAEFGRRLRDALALDAEHREDDEDDFEGNS